MWEVNHTMKTIVMLYLPAFNKVDKVNFTFPTTLKIINISFFLYN